MMKRRFGPSLYFASDKVIFDAMNHPKVTTDQIRELLFERNIVVSAKTSKYELAQYFSCLTADYFDHKAIGDKLGKVAKRERITYTEVINNPTKEEIIEALQAVKKQLEEKGDTLDIDVKDGRVVATLSYEFIDYTEVEFRQVQPRDAVIEFIADAEGNYVVRNTQNKFTDTIVQETFIAINVDRPKPIQSRRITLTGFSDPLKRTKFFNQLISSIDGYSFVTVTEAYCFKPELASSITDEDDEGEKELEDQAFVERITLKGKGVTKSFVIDDLYGKGYYIIKVVWHVKSKASADADIIELEAQFSEPKECTDFSYQTKCVIICEEGKPTNKKRTPKSEEQDTLFRLIEASAKSALASLED